MNNLSNKHKLKEYSNIKPILKEILKIIFEIGNKKEDIWWRKSKFQSDNFNKQIYRSTRKKIFCKYDGKHKKQQMDKHEDVCYKRTSKS